MDSLSAILASVRLSSTAISTAHFGAPWAVRTAGAPAAIFHAVLHGSAVISAEGLAPLPLSSGDIVVLPHGGSHTIGDHPATPPIPVRDLRGEVTPSGVPRLDHGGPGPGARIFCGTFHLEHDAERSLLSLLPEIMHVRAARGDDGEGISDTLRLLDREVSRGSPGSRTIVLRLCDVLFVQVLREHVHASPAGARGWLAALRDEHVGKALALIHQNPAEKWDARLLATRAGTSRSRLFARFTELVGEPPARYVARWRILTAADLLGSRRASVADVAERVGYSSEDAFVKAFKRHLGTSPAEYRKRQSGQGVRGREALSA